MLSFHCRRPLRLQLLLRQQLSLSEFSYAGLPSGSSMAAGAACAALLAAIVTGTCPYTQAALWQSSRSSVSVSAGPGSRPWHPIELRPDRNGCCAVLPAASVIVPSLRMQGAPWESSRRSEGSPLCPAHPLCRAPCLPRAHPRSSPARCRPLGAAAPASMWAASRQPSQRP